MINPFSTDTNRLTDGELYYARYQRLKEVQMWSIIREALTYFGFIFLLFVIIYADRDSNSFRQVQHLQTYFYNSRHLDLNYKKVCFPQNRFLSLRDVALDFDD